MLQRDTLRNGSLKKSNRSDDYQLHSVSKDGKGPVQSESETPEATRTSEFGEDDSIRDNILPSEGILKTTDADVRRATPSIADVPRIDLESGAAQWACPGESNDQHDRLMVVEDED